MDSMHFSSCLSEEDTTMGLFGKKKDEQTKTCCCGGNCAPEKNEREEHVRIKVLGSGCPRCQALEASVRAAQAELGMDTPIEHVTDFSQIASYGVMSTPALVVDGKVVSSGRVLKKDEVIDILKGTGK
jgi:small redox-active disulfide protein 2